MSQTSSLTRRQFLGVGFGVAGGVIGAPAVIRASSDLVVGLSTDPVALDTRMSQNTTGVSQINHVLEPLVALDPSTGGLTGVLAESWEPVAGKGWRVRLRRGVKFHNGDDFTAEDVKYTLESIVDPENAKWIQPTIKGKMGRLQGVQVEDKYSAVLLTGAFSRAFMKNLVQTSIVPARVARDQKERFAQRPVGTGPYRFVEYLSGQRLVVEANDQHWRGAPKSKRIVFRFLAENATRLAALESGEVALVNNVPPDAIARIKARGDLDVVAQPTSRYMHIRMVESRPPFDNPKVRLAMNYAVDKEGIFKGIMGGLGSLQSTPWPPSMLGHNDQLKPFPYDPDRARQLLKEAGASSLKIKYGGPVGRYLNDKLVSEAVLTQLRRVGIEAEPDLREFGAFFQNVFQRKYDAFLLGYSYGGLDPENAREFWYGKSNLIDYKNPRVDQLFDQGDSTPSEAEAGAAYRELAGILWNDVPEVWMYYQPDITGVSKRLRGWRPRIDEVIQLWGAELA
jgi:peptide/nickel transport system substrate-binding protein